MEVVAFMSSLSAAVLTIWSAFAVQFLFSVGLHRAYLHSIFVTVLQLVGVGSGTPCVLFVGILCPKEKSQSIIYQDGPACLTLHLGALHSNWDGVGWNVGKHFLLFLALLRANLHHSPDLGHNVAVRTQLQCLLFPALQPWLEGNLLFYGALFFCARAAVRAQGAFFNAYLCVWLKECGGSHT